MKRIQKSFESTTNHVNDTEAWNELRFPTPREHLNGNLANAHVVAAGDVKYNNKLYRLSLWTDRLYITEYKKSRTPTPDTHVVHRECYRCMIGPGKGESEDLVKIIIYSCLSDSNDKSKKFQAWEPKRFEFEPQQ